MRRDSVRRYHPAGHVVSREADSWRIREIRDKIAGIAEADSLITLEQFAAPIVIEEQLAAGLGFIARSHHHKRRQIVRFAAKAIRQPGSHAGTARNLRTGHEKRDAGRVVHGFGVHAANDTNIVSDRSHIRQH